MTTKTLQQMLDEIDAVNEQNIQAITGLIRTYHRLGEREDFDRKLAVELEGLEPETVEALVEARNYTRRDGAPTSAGAASLTHDRRQRHDQHH